MFWLLNPGTVIGTQDNVLVPMIAVKWRAKKGQFDVMTERTVRRGHTSSYDCTTKISFLPRYDSEDKV